METNISIEEKLTANFMQTLDSALNRVASAQETIKRDVEIIKKDTLITIGEHSSEVKTIINEHKVETNEKIHWIKNKIEKLETGLFKRRNLYAMWVIIIVLSCFNVFFLLREHNVEKNVKTLEKKMIENQEIIKEMNIKSLENQRIMREMNEKALENQRIMKEMLGIDNE